MDYSGPNTLPAHQNVVVMRHGDRMDNFVEDWVKTAKRPWDPPLVEQGLERAFRTGRELRNELGFPIHRVLVSPFLRCVQTATEAISALCAVEDAPNARTSDGVTIDPSKLKASIEYGLCEMLNTEAIRPYNAPQDGDFGFNISELEAMLPAGTVDSTAERVYKELPRWGEKVEETRERYRKIFRALADKYPTENLLLVTHGEGVGVAVSEFKKGATVYKVDYCAFAKLRRPIFHKDTVPAGSSESFEVLTGHDENGIGYIPPAKEGNDANGAA